MRLASVRSCSILTLASVVVAACSNESSKAAPAATVQHAVTESQLTTVRLTPDAIARLGIATAPVESSTVAPTRTVGGEVVVPPGQGLTVNAPVAGKILAPEGGSVPRPGSHVARGQPLMRLVTLPSDPLGVQQQLAVAEARLQQVKAEADRVARLYADQLVSARDYERAQAELIAARSAVEAARAQQRLLSGPIDGDAGALTPLVIAAPEAGVMRAIHAAPGQTVAAGAPLAEIMRADRLWVRVPVYAGDANRYARDSDAIVHGLAGPSSGPLFRAAPVTAPPSADPAAASVDLFYEVRGGSTALRPGERVGVTLQLVAPAQRTLVVPLSAIVRDLSGGSWVYERVDSLTFARRRVDVARVVSGKAVLASGPRPGTPVLIAGAAELFGTEFGAGH